MELTSTTRSPASSCVCSAAGQFTGPRKLVAITRSTRAASTCPWSRYSQVPAQRMIRSAKQPVSAATGVPVCHIEQAYADVGAELLERCRARRIAPAGDDQMAIRREGFRRPAPIPELAPVMSTVIMSAPSASRRVPPSPAGKMLVDHLPGVVVVALMENLLTGDVHHRAARQGQGFSTGNARMRPVHGQSRRTAGRRKAACRW